MTLTRQLVEHIRGKEIAEVDLQQASLFFLDAIACACAGAKTPVGKKLIQWAEAAPLNSRTAAFLVGALTHITETDDLHRGSVTHPGCIVVPAVLVLGAEQGCTEQEMLKATLHGYEAMCRIGNAVGPAHYRIWHNTGTCGPFGSAMAAATLLGLDETATVDALGNAGTQSSGLWQFLETGAMSKHLHAGRGSEAGVLAAELATTGFTGPADILEGKQGMFAAMCPDAEPDNVMAEKEADWQLRLSSIKPWPCCRHTHPTIDAALELHRILGSRKIEQIEVNTYPAALDVCNRPVTANEYQAKFSLQHCVGRALFDGQITMDSFDETARDSMTPWIDRIKVDASEPYVSSYPAAWGAKVTVTTVEGESFSTERGHCKGDPSHPLNTQEMIDKAQFLFDYGGISAADSQSLSDRILAMPGSSNNSGLFPEVLQRLGVG